MDRPQYFDRFVKVDVLTIKPFMNMTEESDLHENMVHSYRMVAFAEQ